MKVASRINPKFQQILLGLGITIVFVAFIMYGISVFYAEEPAWDKYCDVKPAPEYKNAQNCEATGGRWTQPEKVPCKNDVNCAQQGWCDTTYTCNKEYQKAYEQYSKNVFFIASITGVLAIIAGLMLKVPSVSGGIMAGGIVLLIIGIIKYWTYLSKYLQWALLGILLAILVRAGYKRFGK